MPQEIVQYIKIQYPLTLDKWWDASEPQARWISGTGSSIPAPCSWLPRYGNSRDIGYGLSEKSTA